MTGYIYADNAATTPLAPEVLDAMMPYLKENFGNASGLYRPGRTAREAVENARKKIAGLIGAAPSEIYFTSGGTESDNWALKGTMRKLAASGKRHLVTDAIEHHAVLHSADALEKEGFEVTRLPVDETGRVSASDVEGAIRKDTGLVSIMYANNEVGTIQPINEIGKICRNHGVLFHTDAVQAAGILPLDVKKQPIDMLSVSAHKFHGPKGIGFLYAGRDFVPQPFMDGGQQEKNHRAGTENTAGIAGMAEAFSIARENREKTAAHLQEMRGVIQRSILKIPGSKQNGDPENSLPGTLNFSFEGIDGQSLLFDLDLAGVAASSGSACTSANIDPSHVLLAMGLPYALAHGSLRISLSKYNTMEEAEKICSVVKETVERLRSES